MKTKRIFLATAMGSLWFALPAHAADIRWNGFMSIAAGKTLDDGAVYQVEPTSQGIYDNNYVRFDAESVVGLQAQAIISDKLRATVQMVAKGADDFNTSVDWAYLSYDLTPELTLNTGRFRLPLFYYSDFLDVGYAYHWVRPPVDVYNSFTAGLEGVNLYYSKLLGPVQWETQVWYGAIDSEIVSDGAVLTSADFMVSPPVFETQPAVITTQLDVEKNYGVNSTITWNWLSFRLLYNEVTIAQYSDTSIPQPIETIVDADLDVTFSAAALMLDYNNMFVRSEYTRAERTTTSDPSFFDPAPVPTTVKDDYWYASAGYQFNDVTAHITRSKVEADTGSMISTDTTTDTFGLAWRFSSSAVFKIEYSRVDQFAYDPETFVPFQNKFDVVSTAIDLMF